MSDFEDYSILSDNDDNDSEASLKQNKNIKKTINSKPTIRDYDDDGGDDDDGDDDGDDDADDDADDGDIDENEILKDNTNNDNTNDNDYVDNDNEDDVEDGDDEDGDDYEDNSDIEYDNDELEQDKQSGGKPKEKKQNNIALDSQNDYDDFDDDDEEQNENYLQKFDKELTKNYILEFHPECLSHNYDEIKSLSVVTRDQHNIIIDPLHKTLPFLTKYEQARVLGQRAKQIECGSKPLVKVPENIIDSYIIAKLELEQKNIPFIIRRPIPNGGSEYWNIKDLEMIAF
jgi:DNA-directed RNA polymerase subunit K/omega